MTQHYYERQGPRGADLRLPWMMPAAAASPDGAEDEARRLLPLVEALLADHRRLKASSSSV